MSEHDSRDTVNVVLARNELRELLRDAGANNAAFLTHPTNPLEKELVGKGVTNEQIREVVKSWVDTWIVGRASHALRLLGDEPPMHGRYYHADYDPTRREWTIWQRDANPHHLNRISTHSVDSVHNLEAYNVVRNQVRKELDALEATAEKLRALFEAETAKGKAPR